MGFAYNADGRRLYKTDGTNETIYLVVDGVAVGESINNGQTVILYLFDESGNVYGINVDDTNYFFRKNLQGDVVAIWDANGNEVVTYTYDPWGKLLTVTDTTNYCLGTLNPFRYRTYYYDSETGFYYLQSRYYDPEIGRFINADGQLNNDALGCNMFTYCGNNPVNRCDPTGCSFTLACIVVGAIVGVIVGGIVGTEISKKTTGKIDTGIVVGCAAIGGILGGLAGWWLGAAAAPVGLAGTAAAPIIEETIEKTTTALAPYYPPNDGFSGATEHLTLETGELIQRTGELFGRYVAPAGTPTEMLSLPYDKIGESTTILQVQQSLVVLAGRVAPWFGQVGGGIQYYLYTPLDQLIKEGIIKIFEG